MPEPHRIDRRMFAVTLAATSSAAISVLTSPFSANSEDEPASDSKEHQSGDVPEKSAPAAVELLLLKSITQQYPSEHYDDVALQGIYRDLRGDTARGRILSDFSLLNSDEPSFAFIAYRSAE